MNESGNPAPSAAAFCLGVLICFGLAAVAGNIAEKKGRSFAGFFLLALLFPVIGLIIALCVSDGNRSGGGQLGDMTTSDYLAYQANRERIQKQMLREEIQKDNRARIKVYVAKNGQNLGQLNLNQISGMIDSGVLSLENHWLDEEVQEWRELAELEGLA